MKRWGYGLVALAFMVVTAVAFAAAPTTVTIDQCKKRKAAVTFNHKAHVEIVNKKCNVCHHKWNGQGEPQSCFTCHGCKKKGEAPKAMRVFHKRCKSCHRAKKKEGYKAPTSCRGCHK